MALPEAWPVAISRGDFTAAAAWFCFSFDCFSLDYATATSDKHANPNTRILLFIFSLLCAGNGRHWLSRSERQTRWITLTTFPAFLAVVIFTNGLPPGSRGRNKSRNSWRLMQLHLQPTRLRWDLGRYRSDWSPYPPIKIVQPTQSRSAGCAATVTISRLKNVCLPLTPGSPSPSGFAIRF